MVSRDAGEIVVARARADEVGHDGLLGRAEVVQGLAHFLERGEPGAVAAGMNEPCRKMPAMRLSSAATLMASSSERRETVVVSSRPRSVRKSWSSEAGCVGEVDREVHDEEGALLDLGFLPGAEADEAHHDADADQDRDDREEEQGENVREDDLEEAFHRRK